MQLLGKRAPRVDKRTLKLAKYLGQLPSPPVNVNWGVHIPAWPMMLNDNLGDCAVACPGHLIQNWTFNAGQPYIPSNADILAAYEAVGGYKPGDPSTDNGCVVLDVLNYWRNTGISGHKILGYAQIDHIRLFEIQTATYLFGGVYFGFALPVSAQDQEDWTVVLDANGVPSPAGSWGGHAVPAIGYDSEWLYVISWGRVYRVSWAFVAAYADECYGVLSQDWFDAKGLSPSQFDLAALQSDLALLV